MSVHERKKASDVFRDTEYFVARKGSFDEAYAEIKDIRIKAVENGDGVSERNAERYYGKDSGEYVNCSNPLCYNGGFRVGFTIGEMVRTRQMHHEEQYISCQGYEGSPKGRKKYRECMNSFSLTIDVKYKDGQDTEK